MNPTIRIILCHNIIATAATTITIRISRHNYLTKASFIQPEENTQFYISIYSRVSFYDGVTFSNIWL